MRNIKLIIRIQISKNIIRKMQFVFCLWFYKAYILIGAQKQNLTEICNINLSESLWCKCRKGRDTKFAENCSYRTKQIFAYTYNFGKSEFNQKAKM